MSSSRRYAVIWVLLWVVPAFAIVMWLLVHTAIAMLGGPIGPWRLPFGVAVFVLANAALLTFRDPSPWRVLAIAAFIGAAAAFVLTVQPISASVIPWPIQFGVVALALLGAVLTFASHADADES